MKKILCVLLSTSLLIACNKSEQSNPSGENKELANEYFQKGKEYFNSQDYEKAIPLLDSSLLYQSDHISSIATRASAYFNIDEPEKALVDYKRAIELWPTDEANKADLTALYLERGDTYYSLKDYENAIADYTTSIERDPTNDVAYIY